MWEEVSAYFYKHQKIMSRRPGELMWLVVHPFISLLSLGIMIMFIISRGADISSMMFIFVGVIMWNFYDIVQRSITYGITFDIWSSSLKHSFSSRAASKHFIIGNGLFGLYSAVITFVLVGVVGYFAFGFNIFLGGLFLLNLIPVFFFALGIGLMINSLMVSKGEKYMALIWMMTGVIMIFSGVYYPASVLPSPISEIAQAFPSTHSIQSMRAGFGFSPETGLPEFVLGLGLSLLYLAVGTSLFKFGLKKGYQNGTITKF